MGLSLSECPRVGSVAQKHAVYTAKEEQFLVENNCGWRVGLMTDWTAAEALQSIYGVLRSYGMEWKVVSPFHLVVRTTPQTWQVIHHRETGAHPASEKTALTKHTDEGEKRVILGIYLFRIHERHDKGFVVDFSILRNTLLGLNIVIYISDALIRYIG
ncbi:unnamed protein product [Phytomonas sp. Hart1]|nr:unnamed protein product [Phytomonas sp. Hart1]|eukprot:CCW67317.1 unnamed protein product [Phytomonas sp. isolate Hart1]